MATGSALSCRIIKATWPRWYVEWFARCRIKCINLPCVARNGSISFQEFICQAVHKLGLFVFDFGPLYLHRSEVGECVRIAQEVAAPSQVRQQSGVGRRLLPIPKPNPFAADDVQKRVSHGMKAAAESARELLSAKPGRGLQNSVYWPSGRTGRAAACRRLS